MESPGDIERALEKHKQNLGKRWNLLKTASFCLPHCGIVIVRYVEVFESRQSIMEKVKRGSERDRSPGARRGGGGRGGGGGGGGAFGGGGGGFGRTADSVSPFCVKLRGLPWSATKVSPA